MLGTVVKIDICRSKAFASEREASNPSVRSAALKRLLEISQRCFPRATEAYPAGSYYKADGDAVYYVLEKPSVALRGAIEFMRFWYHEGLPEYPECRAFLDRGPLDEVIVPDKTELTGAVFENISIFEKGVEEGHIYATASLIEHADRTMARFRFYKTCQPRPNDSIAVYVIDFADPRTVADSSLVHALFVAHPKAEEARDRLFELFILEFLLEHESLSDFVTLRKWANKKQYPLPPVDDRLRDIVAGSQYIDKAVLANAVQYRLSMDARRTLNQARDEFRRARATCVSYVTDSIASIIGDESATNSIDMAELVEDYLCAVFSELRMMANYFRETFHLFESGRSLFARFDYILKRRLDAARLRYFDDWRDGFLRGLKTVAEQGNSYVAAIFHNVLATYYLNRASTPSHYQIDKLAARTIILDTNVLYSLVVPASPYHELVLYFVDRLRSLGATVLVYPFTIEEYETSLKTVERDFPSGHPTAQLIARNPWLYQEFRRDESRYLNSMAACRMFYSIARDAPIGEQTFEEIDSRLKDYGLALERNHVSLDAETIDNRWIEMRNAMTSDKWDMTEYWDFINTPPPDDVIRHDVLCVENVARKVAESRRDDLGPKVLLVTVDRRKLLRLRRQYDFIISAEQFAEFMMPYLFMSDMPIKDAERFPNVILSAQLGTLLVTRPPAVAEVAYGLLKEPGFFERSDARIYSEASGMGMALTSERLRLKRIAEATKAISEDERQELAASTADILSDLARSARRRQETADDIDALLAAIAERDRKNEKLQKSLNYWRQQARRE
jgi:hypothetical protein